MMYLCICAFKHLFSHELVINSNSKLRAYKKACIGAGRTWLTPEECE